MAEHKLNQYNKHYSFFTIVSMISIIALILLYITCECTRRRRLRIGINNSSNGYPTSSSLTKICHIFKTLLRGNRPSIHFEYPNGEETFELTTYSKQHAQKFCACSVFLFSSQEHYLSLTPLEVNIFCIGYEPRVF